GMRVWCTVTVTPCSFDPPSRSCGTRLSGHFVRVNRANLQPRSLTNPPIQAAIDPNQNRCYFVLGGAARESNFQVHGACVYRGPVWCDRNLHLPFRSNTRIKSVVGPQLCRFSIDYTDGVVTHDNG